MNEYQNPFSPGAGSPPPELAGRQELLHRSLVAMGRVARGRSAKSMLLTGLRGVGKTVLLTEIRKRAAAEGYKTVLVEVHEAKTIGELLSAPLRTILYELNALDGAGDKVKRAMKVLRGFLGSVKMKVGELEILLDLEPEKGVADSGDIEVDLPNLFEAVGEAAAQKKTLLVLLIDEVQCGIGRTGTFFAYEAAGIVPDAIGMAKGLGGGFPLGAAWVRSGYDLLFTPGSHGTTFGGGPLACAAAHAVLDVIDEETLLEKVSSQSGPWMQSLAALAESHPDIVAGVRGRGYHVALVMKGDPLPWVGRLRDHGLLTARGGTDAIRLMPPLTVSANELETSVDIIDLVLGMPDNRS